jgi:hypothetical protein
MRNKSDQKAHLNCQLLIGFSQEHETLCQNYQLWLHNDSGWQVLMDQGMQHVEVALVCLADQLLHPIHGYRKPWRYHPILRAMASPHNVAGAAIRS